MRIIYAYEFDAADVNVQSGRPYSILKELEQSGSEIVRVFPLHRHVRYLYAPKYWYYRSRHQIYRPDREPLFLKSIAWQIERRVRHTPADILFAPGSHAIAELNTPHHKIFTADATFANVLEFYDFFKNCSAKFIAQGHRQDRQALANCSAAIYPSQWAAQSAINDYGAAAGKIHVIPFGANIEAPDPETVNQLIKSRAFDQLRILFIGSDWHRKGGDIVLASCDILHRNRVPVQLDIVGPRAMTAALPAYARFHGWLDKKNPKQRQSLQTLLARAHFLFVPSLAENYGMTFCEAAAFGVPCLTTDVGGIPAVVLDRRTGFTLPPGAPPAVFAEVLQAVFDSPDRYRSLALASAEDYRARLNWSAFRTAFFRVIRTVLAGGRNGGRAAACGQAPPYAQRGRMT